MKTVTVHEAKTHLSKLLQEVEAGREIVIARGKKPIARLVPERPKKRVFGRLKGKMWMSPDFDEPLEDFKEYM